MEILSRCPEAAVLHSSCLLAEQVSAADIAALCNWFYKVLHIKLCATFQNLVYDTHTQVMLSLWQHYKHLYVSE